MDGYVNCDLCKMEVDVHMYEYPTERNRTNEQLSVPAYMVEVQAVVLMSRFLASIWMENDGCR